MRTVLNGKLALIITMVVAGEVVGVSRDAAASSPEASPTITIHVHNYAKVNDATLNEAEEVATGIFQRVGVRVRWIDSDLTLEGKPEESIGKDTFMLSHILLSILPGTMAERLDVPDNAMGLTPGNGTDRQLIYVFYDRIEAFSRRQMRARQNREITLFASMPKILGYAIAHELGHVLLNLEAHSAPGIMRGGWNCKDLMDVAFGSLGFTSQQAEVIRTEARRRNARQESLEGAKIEYAASAIPMS